MAPELATKARTSNAPAWGAYQGDRITVVTKGARTYLNVVRGTLKVGIALNPSGVAQLQALLSPPSEAGEAPLTLDALYCAACARVCAHVGGQCARCGGA